MEKTLFEIRGVVKTPCGTIYYFWKVNIIYLEYQIGCPGTPSKISLGNALQTI